MERKDLLAMNGKIFQEQGEALNEVGKPTVRGVVVANPANTNCNILAHFANKFPRSHFTCLTRLDENRAYAQVSAKLQVPVTKLSNIFIWYTNVGQIGETTQPLNTHVCNLLRRMVSLYNSIKNGNKSS